MFTVLWIVAVATVSTLAIAIAGRTAIDAARNRVHLQRARWHALGCAGKAQSAVDSTLAAAATDADAVTTWQTLSHAVELSADSAGCHIEMEAAGTRLDANAATREMLQRVVEGSGVDDVEALLDRIEAARDANPLADDRQLHDVLGADSALAAVLTTEPGRLSLATAPAAALVAVPGISRETAAAIVELRSAHPFNDLAEIFGRISPIAADSLVARFPDAERVATPDPDAWLLRAGAGDGVPRVTVVLQWRFVRAGRRVQPVGFRDLS